MSYSTTLSVVVPVEYRRRLDQLAQELSIIETRRVSICELVRAAVERVYKMTPPDRTNGNLRANGLSPVRNDPDRPSRGESRSVTGDEENAGEEMGHE